MMMLKAQENPQHVLLLTLLREIGLRAGAIRHMRYHDLVDKHHKPLHVCRVREKGNVFRQFVTGPNLKRTIVTYIRWIEVHYTPKKVDLTKLYLFSPTDSMYTPLSASTLSSWLLKYSSEAGIFGVRVHPHAFRHTIVGKLMDAGNSLEVVSKFMGHSNTNTTAKHYWLSDIDKLCKNMRNPFTGSFSSEAEKKEVYEEELEYAREKIDAGLGIIYIYNQVIAECVREGESGAAKIRDEIFRRIPNLGEFLSNLASSVCTDATAAAAAAASHKETPQTHSKGCEE